MPTPDWNPTDPDELLLRAKARGTHLRWRRQTTTLATVIVLLATTATFAAINDVDRARQASTLAADGRSTTTSEVEGDEVASSTTTTTTAGGGGDEDDDAASDRDGSTTSTTARTTTTTTGPTGPTTTTTAVASATPAARGSYDAPEVGTYRYRSIDDKGSESDWSWTYELVHRNDKEVRLHRRYAGGSATARADLAGGPDTELSWRADRVIGLNGRSCDEAPEDDARTIYLFPMTAGTTWSWNSTCSNEDMGVIRTRGSAQVTGRTTQQVKGRSVEVWAIDSAGIVEITLQGVTQTHYYDRTDWFAPAYGLTTRIESEVRQTEQRSGAERPVISELLDLDPE